VTCGGTAGKKGGIKSCKEDKNTKKRTPSAYGGRRIGLETQKQDRQGKNGKGGGVCSSEKKTWGRGQATKY